MWLFTKTGFVSIVQNKRGGPDDLIVRSRVRKDLENFIDMTATPEEVRIYENAGTDYQFRCFIERWELQRVMTKTVEELDYPNFKNNFKDDNLRSVVYTKVWNVLWELVPPRWVKR